MELTKHSHHLLLQYNYVSNVMFTCDKKIIKNKLSKNRTNVKATQIIWFYYVEEMLEQNSINRFIPVLFHTLFLNSQGWSILNKQYCLIANNALVGGTDSDGHPTCVYCRNKVNLKAMLIELLLKCFDVINLSRFEVKLGHLLIE